MTENCQAKNCHDRIFYYKYIGEIVMTKDKKIQIRISTDYYNFLKNLCEEKSITMTHVFEKIIDNEYRRKNSM
jgi:hypothetical protein